MYYTKIITIINIKSVPTVPVSGSEEIMLLNGTALQRIKNLGLSTVPVPE